MSGPNKIASKVSAVLQALLMMVVFVCVSYLVFFVFAFFKIDREIYKGAFNFSNCVATIIAMLIVNKANSTGKESFFKMKKLQPNQVVALLIIALGMLGMVTMYIYAADKIAEYLRSMQEAMEDYRESVDRFSETEQAVVPVWDSVLYVINLCFVVPFAEEMCFRGAVYGVLRKGFGPVLSVILSAVGFGILHGVNVHIGYAIACGLILAACYHLTDSLYASILLHMVFNVLGSGVASFMTIERFGIPSQITNRVMVNINLLTLFAMPFAVLAIAYLVNDRRSRIKKEAALAEAAAFATVPADTEEKVKAEEPENSEDQEELE